MSFRTFDGQPVHGDAFTDEILNSLAEGVYFVDRNRRILFWNKAAEAMSGFTAEQVLGRCCADGILMHVDETGRCLCQSGCPLTEVMDDGVHRDKHIFMRHVDGHRVPVHVRSAAIRNHDGVIIGAVEIFSDDTERLSALERLRALEQAAFLDELTGLANRRYFNRAIKASLASFERNCTPFGLAVVDIDHFKQFNDTHGHDAGDRALQMVAQTLSRNCRPYDTPVRWGGEEFVVISEHVDAESFGVVLERMRRLIAESALGLGGEELRVTVSIGASLARTCDTADTILKRADANLYHSKRLGRNRTTLTETPAAQPCASYRST